MYTGVQYMFLYLFFNGLPEMFHSKSRTRIQLPEQWIYIYIYFSLEAYWDSAVVGEGCLGHYECHQQSSPLSSVAGKMYV